MASNANIAANKRKLAKQQAAAAKKIKDPVKKAAMIAKSKANARASQEAAAAARAEKPKTGGTTKTPPASGTTKTTVAKPTGYQIGKGKFDGHTANYWASKGKYGKAKEAYEAAGGTNWKDVHKHLKWRYDGKTFANTPFWKSYAESGGKASPPPKATKKDETETTTTTQENRQDSSEPTYKDRELALPLENWWAEEQYDFRDWLDQVEGGAELNQYDPAGTLWTGGPDLIPKGKYGMRRGPSSYLEGRGIGHNLAYKPWMPISWLGSPDADEPYRGVPGKQAMRDVLYHYGGRTPGRLPGNWKPVNPPGGGSTYPLTRVPLFPTGKMSGASSGTTPPGTTPPGTTPPGTTPPGTTPPGTTPPGTPYRGPLLSQYTGLASATPDSLWRVTGEPEKFTIDPLFGGSNKYTYRVPITFYGGADGPVNTHAIRQTAPGGWTPEHNQWNISGVGGGVSLPSSLSFANWAGTDGSYTNTPNFSVQSGLNFLGSPTYTSIQGQNVPFLASEFGGPVGSTTPSPLGSGAFSQWSLPALRGLIAGEPTGDVVGYNFPRYGVGVVDPPGGDDPH